MDPRNHAAVVTGGASGLGEETAIRLARAGAKVAVFDLNGEAARKAASTIGGIGIECDVSDPDSTTTAFKQAREKHGPTRIVVNCAGIGTAKRIVGRDGPMPLNEFQQVISVNLIGTFNVMRLAAGEMATLDTLDDNERGVIISTASIAAFEGQIGQAAYAASKGGVVALTVPAAPNSLSSAFESWRLHRDYSERRCYVGCRERLKRVSRLLFPSRASLGARRNTLTWSCIAFKTLISMVR